MGWLRTSTYEAEPVEACSRIRRWKKHLQMKLKLIEKNFPETRREFLKRGSKFARENTEHCKVIAQRQAGITSTDKQIHIDEFSRARTKRWVTTNFH